MARYTVENVGTGLWDVRLRKADGGYKVLRVQGSSWNIERAVERELRNNAGAYITSRRGGARIGAGRPTKAVAAARAAAASSARVAEANRAAVSRLNQMFWNIINAGVGASHVANVRATEEMAERMLKQAYNSRGKYNIYSGNLDNAYQATVVQGRKIMQVVRLRKVRGNPFYVNENGRTGKKIVDLLEERHPLRKIRRKNGKMYGRPRYRYKKRWERERGYDNTGIGAGRSMISGFGYAAGSSNRIQSGIILENMAPYAGAVQAKGYDVLPGNARSYDGRALSKQKQLIMNISTKFIKAAKLT